MESNIVIIVKADVNSTPEFVIDTNVYNLHLAQIQKYILIIIFILSSGT